MANRDYYEILGVGRDAEAAEIKKAYRASALRYHPDRNPGDSEAEDNFKEAAEAYSVLADPERRSRYDRFGADGVRGVRPNFEGDLFADFSDILGGFFGFDVGGRGRRTRGGPQAGSSLQYRLDIDLEQAVRGDEIEIKIPRKRACAECNATGSASAAAPTGCTQCGGSGQVHQRHGFLTIAVACRACDGEGSVVSDPCERCGGVGRVGERAKLEIKVPPGVDSGMRLLLRGEGEAGRRGGPAGDLSVLIGVRDHARFVRRDRDLFTQVPVSFPTMALGGDVEVVTLDGEPARVTIPRGAQPGTIVDVAGRGMPSVNGGRRGDLRVAVQVAVPRRLGEREQEILEELAELLLDASYDDETPSWWDRLRDAFG